ncbi:MAG: bifunctional pyr operon transcriptional regulator/uracil phosphoribosyltransferase PyrR [Actinomycetota bacterium]
MPRDEGAASSSNSSSVEPATIAQVLTGGDVSRVLTRMAHEIIERNHHTDRLHIIGIQRGGVWLAERLVESVRTIRSGVSTHFGSLDVSLFRDDISLRPVTAISTSTIEEDLTGATVVLVDDVLFTGRTVRAALDALAQFGRPERVQLAVLVDRGHRELPIRPDFVGKNLPTSRTAEVEADSDGVRIIEGELR